jgi:hypothetical protein
MLIAENMKTEFWKGRQTVWQNYKGAGRTVQYFMTFWKSLGVLRLQETFSKKVRTDQDYMLKIRVVKTTNTLLNGCK